MTPTSRRYCKYLPCSTCNTLPNKNICPPFQLLGSIVEKCSICDGSPGKMLPVVSEWIYLLRVPEFKLTCLVVVVVVVVCNWALSTMMIMRMLRPFLPLT